MRLESLTLKNWRSHKSTKLEFDRVNVLRGPNASGKSSIAMAIEYLLTGRCEVTTENGGNGEQLVSVGQKQASIEGNFSGGLSLTRSRSVAGGNLILNTGNGINLAGREATKWMTDHGWAPDLLSVVLRSARFLELSPGDQQRILASVVEPQVIDIPKEMLDLAAVVGCGVAHRLSSVKEAETFRSVFYSRRTELSQAIAAIGKIEAPLIEDVPSLSETQDKLAAIEREWRALDDGAAAKLESFRQAVERHEDAVELRVDLLLAQPSDEESKAWDAIIQRRNDCESTASRRTRLIEGIDWATKELEQAKAASAVCGTCKQAIPEKVRDYAIQQTGAKLGSLRTELAALPVPPDAEALSTAERCRAKAMRTISALADVEKILSEPEPVEPALEETQKQLVTLQNRIAKGRAIVERIVEYRAKLKAYDAAEEQRSQLQTKHHACTKLVEYFGPGGVQAQIVGERMGAMVETLRAKMVYWGFEVGVSMDPYGIQINGLVPAQLSMSERFRFSVALQVTLAQLTGIKLVVIDAADVLTLDLRRILAQLVMDSTLDQAFILSTADSKGNTQDGPLVKFFWLDNPKHKGVAA